MCVLNQDGERQLSLLFFFSFPPHFNSLLEVREMTAREREKKKGREGQEEGKGRRREQVDSLINNHKVRQAVPGWVGPVRKQQLRICRACKGLKQHCSAFFVPLARPLKGQGDTCWWLRGMMDSRAVPSMWISSVSAGRERRLKGECYSSSSSKHQRDVKEVSAETYIIPHGEAFCVIAQLLF